MFDKSNRNINAHSVISIKFTILELEDFIYNKRHTSAIDFISDIIKRIEELKKLLK